MKLLPAISSLPLLLLLASSALYASGVGWLGDAPIRYFSEKDTELMKNAVQNALSSHEDGVILEWVNPETGHRGSVTPLGRKTVKGLPCRNAQLFNSAGGRTANSEFAFCQQADGKWKLENR